MEKLRKIQEELKAPKNQQGHNYKYRSCEDILEAVKPLLKKHDCTLTLSDTVGEVGGLVFIDSTAVFNDGEESVRVQAQAGIEKASKIMVIAQSFGASSSYARKYALNGLFLIDDTKDVDAQEPVKTVKPKGKGKPTISQVAHDKLKEKIIEGEADIIIKAEKAFTLSPEQKSDLEALQADVDLGK